ALEEGLPALEVIAVRDRAGGAVLQLDMGQALALRQLLVDDLVRTVVRHDRDRVEALLLLETDPARLLGDRRLALRNTSLEELLHARETAGDVVTDATLVEGTHRQLGARLTDRLGGDDADGLA